AAADARPEGPGGGDPPLRDAFARREWGAARARPLPRGREPSPPRAAHGGVAGGGAPHRARDQEPAHTHPALGPASPAALRRRAANGLIAGGRYRHHAVSQYSAACRAREASTPDL